MGIQLLGDIATPDCAIAHLLPAYMNERKSWDKRDSTLMLPWILVLAALVTQRGLHDGLACISRSRTCTGMTP